MADDIENDDQWLYGEGDNIDPPPPAPQADKPVEVETPPVNEPQTETHDDKLDVPSAEVEQPSSVEPSKDKPTENGETVEEDKQNGDGSDKEDYDEDSDDDVNVVIGDIKTSPTYASLNIKRGGLLTTTTKGDKTSQAPQPGKFSVEEFEQVGLINGIPANEFNLDSLEDKPWRKPGADITDYFNYGFNEDTWRAYCERQKRMRVSESGTGLLPLNAIGMPRGPVPIMNDNSKYSGAYAGIRKAGPPPGRRMTGSIDVIGGATTRIGVPVSKVEAPKENVIQVMTADRREYSRKPTAFPDMSVPPPTTFEEFHPEYDFNPEPEPFYGGYEPTQDLQWGGNSSWQPQEIKTLTPSTPGPVLPPTPVPPVNMPMNTSRHPPMPVPSPVKEEIVISRRSKSKEKESVRRDRDRSRDVERDRDRERSHRRDRSRSRSRRHKSRSRSPNHRSHRKKKSRRHDDSD